MLFPDDSLRVYPDIKLEDAYVRINMDASGIRWDVENRCLVSESLGYKTYKQRFNIICAAIKREYGKELFLTKLTSWYGVSDEVQTQIEIV